MKKGQLKNSHFYTIVLFKTNKNDPTMTVSWTHSNITIF